MYNTQASDQDNCDKDNHAQAVANAGSNENLGVFYQYPKYIGIETSAKPWQYQCQAGEHQDQQSSCESPL